MRRHDARRCCLLRTGRCRRARHRRARRRATRAPACRRRSTPSRRSNPPGAGTAGRPDIRRSNAARTAPRTRRDGCGRRRRTRAHTCTACHRRRRRQSQAHRLSRRRACTARCLCQRGTSDPVRARRCRRAGRRHADRMPRRRWPCQHRRRSWSGWRRADTSTSRRYMSYRDRAATRRHRTRRRRTLRGGSRRAGTPRSGSRAWRTRSLPSRETPSNLFSRHSDGAATRRHSGRARGGRAPIRETGNGVHRRPRHLSVVRRTNLRYTRDSAQRASRQRHRQPPPRESSA